jgi:hypothetical protein
MLPLKHLCSFEAIVLDQAASPTLLLALLVLLLTLFSSFAATSSASKPGAVPASAAASGGSGTGAHGTASGEATSPSAIADVVSFVVEVLQDVAFALACVATGVTSAVAVAVDARDGLDPAEPHTLRAVIFGASLVCFVVMQRGTRSWVWVDQFCYHALLLDVVLRDGADGPLPGLLALAVLAVLQTVLPCAVVRDVCAGERHFLFTSVRCWRVRRCVCIIRRHDRGALAAVSTRVRTRVPGPTLLDCPEHRTIPTPVRYQVTTVRQSAIVLIFACFALQQSHGWASAPKAALLERLLVLFVYTLNLPPHRSRDSGEARARVRRRMDALLQEDAPLPPNHQHSVTQAPTGGRGRGRERGSSSSSWWGTSLQGLAHRGLVLVSASVAVFLGVQGLGTVPIASVACAGVGVCAFVRGVLLSD